MMALFYLSGQVHQDGQLDAEQLLRGLSVTGKLVGFRYAVCMVEQVTDDPDGIYLITKRLYPKTAHRFGVTVSSVERALRNVVHASCPVKSSSASLSGCALSASSSLTSCK